MWKAPEMARILVTAPDLHPSAVELIIEAGMSLDYMPGEQTEDALVEALGRAPAFALLQRGNPPVTRRVMKAGLPALRMISRHGVGINTLDLPAATEFGLPVATVGDAGASAVAEHTMALMLAAWRDVVRLDARLKAGHWDHGTYMGREIEHRTLGLVGFGRIAGRVAALAKAFGMRVIATSRTPSRIDPDLAEDVGSLDALLAEADIVSLHLPLTDATRNLIGRDQLDRMKKGALLLNLARGGLVDEVALAERLHQGALRGAAVDVLANEPPGPSEPLLAAPNVVATPHIAAFTEGSVERTATTAARNIIGFRDRGCIEPALLANPETGYGRDCGQTEGDGA